MKNTSESAALRPDETEVEITRPPQLTPEQARVVDFHSVLNILSILSGLLELLHEPEDCLDEVAGEIYSLAELLRLKAAPGEAITLDMGLPQRVRQQVRQAVVETGRARQTVEVAEMLKTLEVVLEVFEVRLAELERRLVYPGRWDWMRTSDLAASLQQVLDAIEQNAHGRYRIVKNIADQTPADYQVSLEFSSCEKEWISLPGVMQDVMRDLIANARKYSPPGARINAGLSFSSEGLRLVVEDNGSGIPAPELRRVVEFGYRGTNATDRPTCGGGFGLTKAHWVTHQFLGRMWVRSEVGRGTRITIWIPLPPELPPKPWKS